MMEILRYHDGVGPDCLIFPATKEEKAQHGKDWTWVPVIDKEQFLRPGLKEIRDDEERQ